MSKTYSPRNTKIFTSKGFHPPAEFYRDNPQFTDADGWIEVISDTTAVIKIDLPNLSKEEATSIKSYSAKSRACLQE